MVSLDLTPGRGGGKVRNDKKQAENDEDSNNGNKRLTGTNAMHASSEYTGAFRSILDLRVHVCRSMCRSRVSLHV